MGAGCVSGLGGVVEAGPSEDLEWSLEADLRSVHDDEGRESPDVVAREEQLASEMAVLVHIHDEEHQDEVPLPADRSAAPSPGELT